MGVFFTGCSKNKSRYVPNLVRVIPGLVITCNSARSGYRILCEEGREDNSCAQSARKYSGGVLEIQVWRYLFILAIRIKKLYESGARARARDSDVALSFHFSN